MARKTRQTTSVSTLIQDVNTLIQVAAVSNRQDLLRVLAPLHKDTAKLAAEYLRIRAEIDPLKAVMLKAPDMAAILASVEKEAVEAAAGEPSEG